jgi:hypothetical protein
MVKAMLGAAVVLALGQSQPFNGKDLSGWKFAGDAAKSKWKVGKASLDAADPKQLAVAAGNELVNAAAKHGDSVDAYTEEKWGDAVFEVEVMVPKGSNSGIYVMGEYELQVLDSFGKPNEKMGMGDMGALYSAAVPKVNASKAPGEWQKYVIDFRAPKFNAYCKKTANAKFVKITLNDQVIHENVEMKGPTPGGVSGKEAAAGPLMFQGNHGPVAYRNIKITPVK